MAKVGQAFTTRSLRGAQTSRSILNAYTIKFCLSLKIGAIYNLYLHFVNIYYICIK